MLCVGRAIEFRKEVFTEWRVLNLGRHTLTCGWQSVLDFRERRVCATASVRGRGILGSLIVSLNRGQFIDELFTAVELADFGKVNFGEPVLHFGMFLIRDHAVAQFALS